MISRAPTTGRNGQPLAGIGRILAVSSAKGGVGKSTLCVNLAYAFHRMGKRVGILDADILGPSIAGMLGIDTGEKPVPGPDGKIRPATAHGIRCVSMAMFSSDDQPMILRGPMVGKYLGLFLSGVAWGDLDLLLVDMPPGTGDVQLNIAQSFPLSGAIVVTTPQAVSVRIARRGMRMFQAVHTPILGVVENMRSFACPECGTVTDLFGSGGGEALAKELDVPFVGALPLDPQVVKAGDSGAPIAAIAGGSATALAYDRLAAGIAAGLDAPPRSLPRFRWNLESGEGAPEWDESAIRADGARDVPAGLRATGSNGLELLWQDGVRQQITFRDLRLACGCALCRDELTGRPLVDPSAVPSGIRPVEIRSIGSYAIGITWSDGHSTGIHPFSALRRMGDKRSAVGR